MALMAQEVPPAVFEVLLDVVGGILTDRHDARLAALAANDGDRLLRDVDIPSLEAAQLGGADAAAIKQLDDGPVPQAGGSLWRHCLQHLGDLPLGEHVARQTVLLLGQDDGACRVLHQIVVLHQVVEETPDHREHQAPRGGAQTPTVRVRDRTSAL